LAAGVGLRFIVALEAGKVPARQNTPEIGAVLKTAQNLV
jgi:hypothetical protein